MRGADVKQLTKALEELQVEYREAVVFQVLERLSSAVPTGRFMCGNWRAAAWEPAAVLAPIRKVSKLGLRGD